MGITKTQFRSKLSRVKIQKNIIFKINNCIIFNFLKKKLWALEDY